MPDLFKTWICPAFTIQQLSGLTKDRRLVGSPYDGRPVETEILLGKRFGDQARI